MHTHACTHVHTHVHTHMYTQHCLLRGREEGPCGLCSGLAPVPGMLETCLRINSDFIYMFGSIRRTHACCYSHWAVD